MLNFGIAARFLRKLAQFEQCRRGNVAMIFGLAIIPIVGVVGVAVNYSRANDARTSMQAALDAAALILSKEAQTLTPAQLMAKAKTVFAANFNAPNVKNVEVTPVFTTLGNGSYSLSLAGHGLLDTTVASLWQPTIEIGSSAEVVWGMKRLELVLALDNTGSMASSNKMTELKKAAKDLLKTLQTAAKKADDVKVGIVPFATDVNIGTDNVKASWVRWDEWEKDDINYTCKVAGKEILDNRNRRITNATDCKNRDERAVWQLNDRSTWNGCVWDRDQSNDVNNTEVVSTKKATLYSVHNASNCPVPMMTLSNNWTALNNKINDMQPVGNTNVTIGLQVAFQMLSPVAPFKASVAKPDLDKVIILLTDGDNTENRWSKSQTAIDARTRLACSNVKAANIQIYTIRVINGNTSLLRDCATKSDMYFDVDNASQLSVVFSTIAQNLANLRLSQ